MTGLLEGILAFAAFVAVAGVVFAVVCWGERGNKTW
jgi:hypothetical protein